MKKTTLFLVLLALFGVWEGVVAQEDNREAYAVLDADGLDEWTAPGWVDWDEGNTSITSVVFDASFSDYDLESAYCMFANCTALESINFTYFNTSEVTNMGYMFAGCSSLQSLNLSNFNTANVVNMSGMFGMCSSLQTLNVSNFNTTNVGNMSYMFYGCTDLTTIYCNDDWNRGNNQQYSEEMFSGCSQLEGAVQYSDYNANDVTFANPDDGYFTASGPRAYAVLTNGKLTFYYDELKSTRNGVKYSVPWNSGNQNDWNGPGWVDWDESNTSITSVAFDESFRNYNLVSAFGMFATCTALESIDFTNFNTSAVTNMGYIFYNCGLQSLNLSSFNTSAVTNMEGMFSSCENLRALNLTSFNTANVVNMRDMFYGCSNLETIYCNDNWSETSVNLENSDCMFYECTNLPYHDYYCNVTYAKPSTEGGNFTAITVRPYAVLTDNGTLTFYYDDSVDKILDSHTSYVYYNLDWGYSNPEWSGNNKIKTVTFDASFGEYQIASTGAMFYELYNLTKVNGLENLNTSNVEYMWSMVWDVQTGSSRMTCSMIVLTFPTTTLKIWM